MSLSHALLGLLAVAPASGYELTKEFEQQPWPLRLAGRAHQHLSGAEQAGRARADPGGQRGAARGEDLRHHRRGPRGAAHLAAARPDENAAVRNEQVLRMFLLSALPPEDQRLMLTSIAERTAAAAAELRELLAAVPGPDAGPRADFGRLAGEFGVRQYESVHDWALWALDQLDRTRPARDRPTRPRRRRLPPVRRDRRSARLRAPGHDAGSFESRSDRCRAGYRRRRGIAAVRAGTRADLPAAAGVLGRAFQAEPVYEWLLPDPGRRRRRLPVPAAHQPDPPAPRPRLVRVATVDGRIVGVAIWDGPRRARAGPSAAGAGLAGPGPRGRAAGSPAGRSRPCRWPRRARPSRTGTSTTSAPIRTCRAAGPARRCWPPVWPAPTPPGSAATWSARPRTSTTTGGSGFELRDEVVIVPAG